MENTDNIVSNPLKPNTPETEVGDDKFPEGLERDLMFARFAKCCFEEIEENYSQNGTLILNFKAISDDKDAYSRLLYCLDYEDDKIKDLGNKQSGINTDEWGQEVTFIDDPTIEMIGAEVVYNKFAEILWGFEKGILDSDSPKLEFIKDITGRTATLENVKKLAELAYERVLGLASVYDISTKKVLLEEDPVKKIFDYDENGLIATPEMFWAYVKEQKRRNSVLLKLVGFLKKFLKYTEEDEEVAKEEKQELTVLMRQTFNDGVKKRVGLIDKRGEHLQEDFEKVIMRNVFSSINKMSLAFEKYRVPFEHRGYSEKELEKIGYPRF